MALTNTEKQRNFRKRQAALGRKEMRGVYVTDSEEIEIKKTVKIILDKMRNNA